VALQRPGVLAGSLDSAPPHGTKGKGIWMLLSALLVLAVASCATPRDRAVPAAAVECCAAAAPAPPAKASRPPRGLLPDVRRRRAPVLEQLLALPSPRIVERGDTVVDERRIERDLPSRCCPSVMGGQERAPAIGHCERRGIEVLWDVIATVAAERRLAWRAAAGLGSIAPHPTAGSRSYGGPAAYAVPSGYSCDRGVSGGV
jgi:hypothetical protein